METKNCNFEREKCIGRGSFGKVYLCFDKKEPQKKFAMKIIDLEGSSEDERNSAPKEALLLTTLQHKYMLHALSVYQENETLCIVTEFCDQGDLAQFLEKRRGNLLEEERIVEWFRQICSALEYLHQKKVLHRDIKPQNIFLTGKEMTIKLGDLGLAKVLERSKEKALTKCGTPYYMSPEIVSGKPYNFKSDIWAMGVCIYEMTTLKRPFDACFLHQLHLKIANEQLPPIPKDEHSTLLINVIERMLCKDADSRPLATELLQDFLFKNQQTSIESLEYERVYERDAIEFEKQIFIRSSDTCNMKTVEKIPIDEISKFLDGLQKSGGIDNILRRRLHFYGTDFVSDSFVNKEWDFKISLSNLHGQFGVVILRKSEDEGYVEFIKAMYKIDSEIIPECRNKFGDKRIENFIRKKALQRFDKEGLIFHS